MRIALVAVLWVSIATGTHAGQGSGQTSEKQGNVFKNSVTQEFRTNPMLPGCFTGALQRINTSNGGLVFLVRSGEQGCTVPSHWHSSPEQISMVSGVAVITMDDGTTFTLKEGGYAYLLPKHIHTFKCPGACVHFEESIGPFDIHYVNHEGVEISVQEALKATK